MVWVILVSLIRMDWCGYGLILCPFAGLHAGRLIRILAYIISNPGHRKIASHKWTPPFLISTQFLVVPPLFRWPSHEHPSSGSWCARCSRVPASTASPDDRRALRGIYQVPAEWRFPHTTYNNRNKSKQHQYTRIIDVHSASAAFKRNVEWRRAQDCA